MALLKRSSMYASGTFTICFPLAHAPASPLPMSMTMGGALSATSVYMTPLAADTRKSVERSTSSNSLALIITPEKSSFMSRCCASILLAAISAFFCASPETKRSFICVVACCVRRAW